MRQNHVVREHTRLVGHLRNQTHEVVMPAHLDAVRLRAAAGVGGVRPPAHTYGHNVRTAGLARGTRRLSAAACGTSVPFWP
jgi:hypothetical protein